MTESAKVGSGKVAVVTGGNRGLGFEASRQLARRGVRVVLTSRDPVQGEAAAAMLRDEGLEVTPYRLDVTDAASIAALAAFLQASFGGGGACDLRDQRAGPAAGTQALVPLMRNGGRIVNVSSGMGQLSDMAGGWAGYRISKTGLNALTRILAADLRDRRITVNSVCPGWVRTDMGGASATRSPEEGVETIVWLATQPDEGLSGGFFRDKKPIPW